MAEFDLTVIEELKKYAAFGKAVIMLAQEKEIVPKRPRYRTRTVQRTRIVVRSPRRTKAEIAAAAGPIQPSAPTPTTTLKQPAKSYTTLGATATKATP